MTETTLATEGDRPYRVRVYTTTTAKGSALVRVEWREESRRRREARPDSKAARAWAKDRAKTIAARLRLGQAVDTRGPRHPMGDVVREYLESNAHHWRPRTATGAANKLAVWLAYVGGLTPIETVTAQTVDAFRAHLRTTPRAKTGRPMAAHQISRHAHEVKALFRFALAREILKTNPLASYVVKLAKDERQMDVAEYSNDEWAAVLAELSPRKALQWRPYALIVLGGILGGRQTALRSLRWPDVDLDARTVTWRAETDKVGRERVQPLPRAAVRAFRIAKVWRQREGYEGPWIFYGMQGRTRAKPYTYQALNYQLHEAERRAGVTPKPYRAMHGLRRTAAGNALEQTSNIKTAGLWIGDTDPKSLNRYLKQRDAQLEQLAKGTNLPSRTAIEQPTAKHATEPKRRSVLKDKDLD